MLPRSGENASAQQAGVSSSRSGVHRRKTWRGSSDSGDTQQIRLLSCGLNQQQVTFFTSRPEPADIREVDLNRFGAAALRLERSDNFAKRLATLGPLVHKADTQVDASFGAERSRQEITDLPKHGGTTDVRQTIANISLS